MSIFVLFIRTGVLFEGVFFPVSILKTPKNDIREPKLPLNMKIFQVLAQNREKEILIIPMPLHHMVKDQNFLLYIVSMITNGAQR